MVFCFLIAQFVIRALKNQVEMDWSTTSSRPQYETGDRYASNIATLSYFGSDDLQCPEKHWRPIQLRLQERQVDIDRWKAIHTDLSSDLTATQSQGTRLAESRVRQPAHEGANANGATV